MYRSQVDYWPTLLNSRTLLTKIFIKKDLMSREMFLHLFGFKTFIYVFQDVLQLILISYRKAEYTPLLSLKESSHYLQNRMEFFSIMFMEILCYPQVSNMTALHARKFLFFFSYIRNFTDQVLPGKYQSFQLFNFQTCMRLKLILAIPLC